MECKLLTFDDLDIETAMKIIKESFTRQERNNGFNYNKHIAECFIINEYNKQRGSAPIVYKDDIVIFLPIGTIHTCRNCGHIGFKLDGCGWYIPEEYYYSRFKCNNCNVVSLIDETNAKILTNIAEEAEDEIERITKENHYNNTIVAGKKLEWDCIKELRDNKYIAYRTKYLLALFKHCIRKNIDITTDINEKDIENKNKITNAIPDKINKIVNDIYELSNSGLPDIFAIKDNEIIFIESKMNGITHLKDYQKETITKLIEKNYNVFLYDGNVSNMIKLNKELLSNKQGDKI